ncbi:hypothetical protein NLG97_g5814 [Lecanicillium saksenae]|uniref:Uncharacterized protein n=1 Tax=Lecanicillium saksenae TaxID=468837 RepID=A0ACC1QUK8_9HYPO|nr:hypothetical protein NLG97_g5814 [Lecanicillium saksenae]
MLLTNYYTGIVAGPRPCIVDSGRQCAPSGPPVSIQQSLCASQRLKRQLAWYQKQKYKSSVINLSSSEHQYLEESGAFLELPHSTVSSLLAIYVSCLNDLIPLVDGAALLRDSSNGSCSRFLVRAICLIACKDKQALPFLQLAPDGPLLPPLDFAAKLRRGLEAAGCDQASQRLSQAVHEAWSISLHWDIPGNVDQTQCNFLWWTLRNFDRLNKPVMAAAPFMIDDTDIGIDRIQLQPGPEGYRSQVMRIATPLGDLIKSATKVYKATCKTIFDDSDMFPEFSDLTTEVEFKGFHRMHKCYFEIWYHVAAMLSCRFSGPGTIPYRRRLRSADGILWITSEQSADTLPPLPLVPYAVSLATTMIYRALRDGQRQVKTVRQNLMQCCDILSTLAPMWTCVRGIEKLARRLLKLLSAPHTKSQNNTESNYGVVNYTPRNEAGDLYLQPASSAARMDRDCSCSGPCQCLPWNMMPGADIVSLYGQEFPFDTAFHEMFDGGVPNVFRGHATWEMLNYFDTSSPTVPNYESMFTGASRALKIMVVRKHYLNVYFITV